MVQLEHLKALVAQLPIKHIYFFSMKTNGNKQGNDGGAPDLQDLRKGVGASSGSGADPQNFFEILRLSSLKTNYFLHLYDRCPASHVSQESPKCPQAKTEVSASIQVGSSESRRSPPEKAPWPRNWALVENC